MCIRDRVKDMLASGKLEMGQARALLSLPSTEQAAVATKIASQGLSVRATEALVRQADSGEKKPKAKKTAKDPDTLRLENDLGETLGASVNIRHSRGGKGVLEIRYNSLDELDGILKHIK